MPINTPKGPTEGGQSALDSVSASQKEEISHLFQQEKPENLLVNLDSVRLDEDKGTLKKLAVRLVDQRKNGGIDILEGDQELCKDVYNNLAQATNREIVIVQCSAMDPSDMLFTAKLEKGETTIEPADWIKFMQKPGTIVVFEEIDKLNDQCLERLHSLFDKSKSVYDPQFGKVEANPDCIFLGTKNRNDSMQNPILTRGRILEINYPTKLNEAYKISKYADSPILEDLTYEEFAGLYEKYIVRKEPAPSDTQEKEIYELIININHLSKIFRGLRKKYDSEVPFLYELSYRDARHIFVDYNGGLEFKEALENVLIPKARATVRFRDEKTEQEKIVREIIDEEMK